MNTLALHALVLLFAVSGIILGSNVMRNTNLSLHPVLRSLSSFLTGYVLVGTLSYGLSVAFASTGDPIPLAVLTASCVSLLIAFMMWRYTRKTISAQEQTVHVIDWLVIIGVSAVSAWLMQKSFRQGGGSTLLIGSNEVFDFGHAISIVRSFSLGNNYPYSSPFVAGAPHLYHFLFWFSSGVLERLGMPLVLAVNIPSAVSFAAMLLAVYLLPQVLFGSGRFIGVLAVGLALTNSSLSFVHLFSKYGTSLSGLVALWRLGKYPFSGPYDGSVISIFTTLNVFVNQRHLAFGIAVALVMFMVAHIAAAERKLGLPLALTLGIIAALLPMWHMMMYVAAVVLVGSVFILNGHWRGAFVFGVASVVGGALWFLPFLPVLVGRLGNAGVPGEAVEKTNFMSALWWIWQNFGMALVTVPLGLYAIGQQGRKAIAPLIILFAVSVLMPKGFGQDAGQKFLNLFTIAGGAVSAMALGLLWRGRVWSKAASTAFGVALFASGIVSFMVIKNDFMYPVVDAPDDKLMAWVRTTPKQSVFVSFRDIFEPAVLSGRKTWFGFFRTPGGPDRTVDLQWLYEASESAGLYGAQTQGVRYMIVPKKGMNDFGYKVNIDFLRQSLSVPYEDEKFVVFAL